MKQIYAYILYAILAVGILFFTWLYIRGPQGLQALHEMYAEQDTLQENNQQLRQEVAQLQHAVNDWQKHPFHKEKVAREQLQMARVDDEVFYVT